MQRLDGGPVVGWQQRDCIFCSKLLFISPLPPSLLLLSDVLHTTTGSKRLKCCVAQLSGQVVCTICACACTAYGRTPPVNVLAYTCTIYLCKYCTSMLVLTQYMLAQLVQRVPGCRRPTLGVLAYACTSYLCLQVLYKYACACTVYACTTCAKLFRLRDAPT